MKNLTTLLSALSMTGLLLAGCGGGASDELGGDSSCRGGKCDDLDKPDSEIEETPCDGFIIDESGRGNQRVAGRLNDPFARFALRNGDSCPTSFQEIQQKLRENDTEGCDPEEDGAGLATRVVSETAQPTGEPTSYRLVTSRTCGDRKKHGIMFSLFGVRAGATSLPGGVEVMAFDETTGVFNYYEADGRGNIEFFGNSHDMLKGTPGGKIRRCAACHTGGGAIMKELDTPWLHWEGHMDIPGARDLVSAHESLLGRKDSGAEFEGLVKASNREWNASRLAFLQENSNPKEILRPLFCTVEVNLDNGSGFESPVEGGEGGDEMDRINFDSLLDPQLKGFGGINIEFADYDAQVKANGQRLAGIEGAIDTVFDYVYPERAHADNDYVDKLKGAGIVDDELIKDILLVDFTRPIFSEDRCGLLEAVPLMANAELNPETLKAGLLANLSGAAAGTPEAELRNNLLTEGGHSEAVDAFTNACEALGSADLVANALTVTSLNRDTARGLHLFEFQATMPDDNLNVAPGTRLHPQTCELAAQFVAVTPEAEGGEEPPPPPEPEACAHDLCEEGTLLVATCDPCVAQICEVDSFCCNNSWDNLCVDQVESVCELSCPLSE